MKGKYEMSQLYKMKRLKLEENTTNEDIKEMVKKSFNDFFEKVVIKKEDSDSFEFKITPKEGFFATIASLKGFVGIKKCKENKTEISFRYQTCTNSWTWISAIFFLILFWPALAYLIWQYHHIKKSAIEDMNSTVDSLESWEE